MSDTFHAPAPRPALADDLALFAPLIGRWELDVDTIDDHGATTTVDGEWTFSWALDGRAVADVWISPARRSRPQHSDGEWGASIRFFDPSIGAWRSTWHGPARGWVIPFIGRACDEGIELIGRRDDLALRWVFFDMTADAFQWRAEERRPDGTLTVRQRFRARRSA